MALAVEGDSVSASMDLITQGLLGATLATSVAAKKEIKTAAAIGAFSGMLADADTLIRSNSDPLLVLDFHRHFSHALVFIPVGALVAAAICWPLAKRHLRFSKVYLFALAGYCLSGLLDACTSYGTHLLWPFSDARVAWDLIAVVDPIFSIALILGLVFVLRHSEPQNARWALAFCCMYLSIGAIQNKRASAHMATLAESRGHPVQRGVVKPTMGNLVVWRSIYLSDGIYHVDAIRLGVLGGATTYEGSAQLRFEQQDVTVSQRQRQDISRFEHFSDGYLIQHPTRPDVIGDIRYSILPHGNIPLWGIKTTADSDAHVSFETYRGNAQEALGILWRMVLGTYVREASPT